MQISSVWLALGALVVSASASAQNATVAFTGNLVAPSCVVQANGGASGNATVTLPTVLTSSLAGAGQRTGRTNWTLQVGTPATPCLHRNVRADFTNAGYVNASGRLNNAGTARNVEVVVRNNVSGQDINLRTNANTPTVAVPASGVAILNYSADYYATAATSPGSVTTNVQYTITYP